MMFFYISSLGIIATIIIFFTSIISTIAGTGGGGVYVPLLMLSLSMSINMAVPISTVSITAASIVSLVDVIISKKIDYNVCLLLVPMITAGSLVGVLMNIVFPNIITAILLILSLIFVCYKSYKKAVGTKIHIKKIESNKQLNPRLSPKSNDEVQLEDFLTKQNLDSIDKIDSINSIDSILPNRTSRTTCTIHITQLKTQTSKMCELCEISEPFNSKCVIVSVIVITIINWTMYLCFAIWRKSEKVCSKNYIISLVLPLVVSIIITFMIICYNAYAKCNGKYAMFLDGLYAVEGFFAGVLGGFLGIGGGMIIGPMLLYMNIEDPNVTSGISTYLVFVSASSSSLQYVLFDLLNYEYGVWLGAWCAVSAILGRFIIKPIILKKEKSEYVIYSLVLIALMSCILAIIDTIVKFHHDVDFKFFSLCVK